jgi:hypothetical protein
MATWVDERERYQKLASSIDPAAKVCVKEESWIMIVASWALFLVTFGMFKRDVFMQGFGTTLGPWEYYSRTKEALSRHFVAHESYHVVQFRKLGLWIHPILGIPANILVYGILPLPIFLAYGRYKIEMNAERFALKYYLEDGATEQQVIDRAVYFAEMITSFRYLWCWPKPWAVKSARKMALEVIEEWKKGKGNV